MDERTVTRGAAMTVSDPEQRRMMMVRLGGGPRGLGPPYLVPSLTGLSANPQDYSMQRLWMAHDKMVFVHSQDLAMPINFNQLYNQAAQAASDAANAASDAASAAADAVQGAAESAGNAVQGAAETTGEAVGGAAENVAGAVQGTAHHVKNAVKGAAGTVGQAVQGAVSTVGSAVQGAAKTTGKAVQGAVDGAIDMGSNTVIGIKQFADTVKTDTTQWVAGKMEDAGIDQPKDLSAGSLFNTGRSIFEVTANNIQDKVANLIGQDNADLAQAIADKAAKAATQSPKENWDDMKKDIREPLAPVVETLKKAGEVTLEKAQDQVDKLKKKTKG